MKRQLIKILYDAYSLFGIVFRRFIPVAFREKIKSFLFKPLRNQSQNKSKINPIFTLPGINLVGFIRSGSGVGQGCRLLASAIEVSGIQWLAISSDRLSATEWSNDTWAHKITSEPQYNTNIIHINPNIIYLSNLYLSQNLWRTSYSIGYCVWELEDIPDEWIMGFDFYDEIWAPSQFAVDAMKKRTNKPIIKVPYGISIENYTIYDREHFKLPDGIFLFLVIYDSISMAARKNPEGAILAFKEAFKPYESNVGLVVKINNAKESVRGEINNLRAELKEYKNVFFIEGALERDEVNCLIHCCDCIVSLHRAEGFGLVPAEAMYVGKPVIATDWSGTTEFINDSNACPVKYKLVELDKDIGPYRAGQSWAEPDNEHAASYMRRLYSDKEYYDSIASNGKKFIRQNYSHEKCADIIKSRLKELELI